LSLHDALPIFSKWQQVFQLLGSSSEFLTICNFITYRTNRFDLGPPNALVNKWLHITFITFPHIQHTLPLGMEWLDQHWRMLEFWFTRNSIHHRIHQFANTRIGCDLIIPVNGCKHLTTANVFTDLGT